MRRREVLAGGVAVLLAGGRAGAAEVLLITEEEAGLPVPAEIVDGTRGLTRGPGVAGEREAAGEAGPLRVSGASPLRLALRFVPRNEVPVDPGSVRVVYVRRPEVDLTARVRAFVTADGIEVAQARVPRGTHWLRVEIRDGRGRSGARLVRIDVP